jgi:hypothetical protein
MERSAAAPNPFNDDASALKAGQGAAQAGDATTWPGNGPAPGLRGLGLPGRLGETGADAAQDRLDVGCSNRCADQLSQTSYEDLPAILAAKVPRLAKETARAGTGSKPKVLSIFPKSLRAASMWMTVRATVRLRCCARRRPQTRRCALFR